MPDVVDVSTRHQIGIQRVAGGATNRMREILEDTEDEIREILLNELFQAQGIQRAAERQRFLDAALRRIRGVRERAYREIAGALAGEARGVVASEVAFNLRNMPGSLRVGDTLLRANEIVSGPIKGFTLDQWMERTLNAEMRAVRGRISSRLAQGDDLGLIVRQVTGSQGVKGVYNSQSRRHLETMVRSRIAGAQEQVREDLWLANRDRINGLVWSSILDKRTSEDCQIRSGLTYENNEEHTPVGHDVPWGEGPGRIHPRCRSSSLPQFGDQPTISMPTWKAWIKRQPKGVQEFALGKTRTKLLREKKVVPEDFFDRRGEKLTLAELARREGLFEDISRLGVALK